MSIRRFIFSLMLACTYTYAVADEMTEQKRADIEQLMDMTNALGLGQQFAVNMAANMIQSVKQTRPDIPPEKLNIAISVTISVINDNIGSLKTQLISLYGKYFTDDEIRDMIRFYASDTGKKAIKVMPVMLQESMATGRQWGNSLVPELKRRLAERLHQQGVRDITL